MFRFKPSRQDIGVAPLVFAHIDLQGEYIADITDRSGEVTHSFEANVFQACYWLTVSKKSRQQGEASMIGSAQWEARRMCLYFTLLYQLFDAKKGHVPSLCHSNVPGPRLVREPPSLPAGLSAVLARSQPGSVSQKPRWE